LGSSCKSTLLMSKDEYERIILEKHKDKLYFDSQICKEATFGDIDNIKVKRFLERSNFERRLEINSNITPKEALGKLNLIEQDKLTNGAILLFGTSNEEGEELIKDKKIKYIPAWKWLLDTE